MSTGERVFLDSGIFIALLDRSDRWHGAARERFSARAPQWHTSLAVVSETYSWFLHRCGEEVARGFRLALSDFTGLKLLAVDEKHHHAVAAKLERHRGQKLTWVDASSLVFLTRERIKTVWGTDHHLGIEGAKVIPGGA